MDSISASVVAYLPVALAALLLNFADIFFLQSERLPPLHKSPSFWLYLIGHLGIALFAAWLLYAKAALPLSDWPIVTAMAALTGFSVVQSLTLKFGGQGVDARELFDSWKRRVLEDLAKTNASAKRIRQSQVANRLAKSVSVESLEAAVHLLAPSMQVDATAELADMRRQRGVEPALLMAQWIASADLSYAESLLSDPSLPGQGA